MRRKGPPLRRGKAGKGAPLRRGKAGKGAPLRRGKAGKGAPLRRGKAGRKIARVAQAAAFRRTRRSGSGDARLFEVGFELFDGGDAVDFVGLDIHELFLGGEDELDEVGDLDVRRVGN